MPRKPTYKELESDVQELRKTVSKNDFKERVYHSTANLIMILDPDQKILSVNLATEKLTGKTSEELIGKKCYQIFHHSETYPAHCPMQKLIKSGQLETMEMVVEALDKRFLISCSPVFDEKSNLKRIIHIGTDLTEHKRVEEALKNSHEKYTKLFQYSNDAIFIHDTEGNILDVNQKALEFFGYTTSEFLSIKIPMLHPSEMIPKSKQILDSILKNNSVIFNIDCIKKDGSTFPTEISTRLFEISGKKVIQGIVRDISERINAETEKRQNEERFKLLFRACGDGILVADIESKMFIEANPAICKILGYSKEELLTKSVIDIHPSDSVELVIQEFIAQAKGENLVAQNIPCLTKNGSVILADISAVQSKIMGKECNIGLFRDVTAIRKLEEKLQQTQKIEAIGTLAGGIAHDFNNMLSVITGNISYAQGNLNKDDELYKILSDVEEASKQAQSLTHQLLTFSKGGAPVKKVSNINMLLKDSALFLIRGAAATCSFKLSDDLWEIEIDEGQINQVISNIVINANQSMPNGGTITIKTENAKIDIESDLPLSTGRYIKISFEDQGIGILKKHLSNIFDPYFTTKQKGSGLGLATTHSIISQHCGHISVYSEFEKGTIFNIYLPASSNKIMKTEDKHDLKHSGQGKILIMDDQEAILRMVGRMLEKMGYDTVLAIDGHQAIEMYSNAYQTQSPFDLAILDLTIPRGMGGAKTVIELLKIDPGAKVVVSSGYSNDPVMANYQEYGFLGMLPKPYTKSQMVVLLNTILGQKD